MQNLKYYVIWVKNSPLLKKYLDKYYHKLLKDLENIKNFTSNIKLKKFIEELLVLKNNKDFILDPDISSLINSIVIDNNIISLDKLAEQLEILFKEWINSKNLTKNKWVKIAWTNIKLTLSDDNPYKWHEAHPDHRVNWWVLWWGEKEEKEWLKVYEKTFNLLKEIDEWIYDELNQIITKIVPLWTARSMHNSSSYKECIWHLYLWYTIDTTSPELNNLEAIIHESSHNKLNLLMHFDSIVLNTKEEIYYSSIRPDARHIHGVLLWYHAFAPTIYIMMKAYLNWFLWDDKSWLEKIVLYHIKVKFLQKVIKKYAKLTPLWKEVCDEMDYVVSEMDILFKKLNPSREMILKSKECQIDHFNEVNRNYPNLEY